MLQISAFSPFYPGLFDSVNLCSFAFSVRPLSAVSLLYRIATPLLPEVYL